MSEQPSLKRTRSPAYPAIDLEEAITKAAVLWTKINRHSASITTVNELWGYDKSSSAGFSASAALLKFGLLLDKGTGQNREVQLTPEAIRLTYNPDKASAEYQQGIKRAALLPKIHAELWRKYGGVIPDDSVIKRYLVVERKFNEQYVDGFIKQFKKTIQFAGLSPSDKLAVPGDDEDEEDLSGVVPTTSSTEPLQQETAISTVSIPSGTVGIPRVFHSKEFSFPLPNGLASLRVPFPLTEDDFSMLIQTLHIFKGGMVKTEMPVINTVDLDWKDQAETLANARIAFNLINFSYVHHIGFYKEISIKYDLESRFDPAKAIAYFKPRQTEAGAS